MYLKKETEKKLQRKSSNKIRYEEITFKTFPQKINLKIIHL